MDRKSEFIEKFKIGECTISWKFNGKLSTIEVQNSLNVQKSWKNSNSLNVQKLWKFIAKFCTLDVQKVRIRGKIQIRWMFNIVKIQWKIVYIRSTDGLSMWKNSNSLKVRYHENSIENCVH